jgi:hypothetical protein
MGCCQNNVAMFICFVDTKKQPQYNVSPRRANLEEHGYGG